MEMERSVSLHYNRKKEETNWFLLLSFLIPVLLFVIGLIAQQVHPFGNRQILVVDFWHQYYPFLCLLREKLQSGESLLFTWDSGMGTNFLAIYAYYAASPCNILLALAPDAILREAVTGLLLLKIGAAGFFYAIFLKHVFHRNSYMICLFGTMYALCSYMMGYYWNIIWLDTVALLPLVMLGLVRIIRHQKIRLYLVSLAVSVAANFYIGWMICIFSVIAFFVIWILEGKNVRILLRCGVLTLFATAVALGLCAVLLIPAYAALQKTFSADGVFPTRSTFYESWRTLASNLIGYHEPTTKEGLPNVYCGILSLVLCGLFLCSRLVRLREKILAVLTTVFLFLSCNWNMLNYIWHGFHFTNMLPYRFSFLISFLLLTVAYRAMLIAEAGGIRLSDWIAMLGLIVAFVVISYKEQPDLAVLMTAGTALVYWFLLFLWQKRMITRLLFSILLSCALLVEQFQNVQISMKAVSTSDYTTYPYLEQDVDAVLSQISTQELNSPFYRVEMTNPYTLNDPALYGYYGVSQFSSTAGCAVSRFLKSVGLPASEAGNRYYYALSTPFNNMLTGISYVISRSGTVAETASLRQHVSSGDVCGYKNILSLPIAYVVGEEAASYDPTTYQNPFIAQNDLFSKMTGVQDPLFREIAYEEPVGSGLNLFRSGNWYTYQMDRGASDGSVTCQTVPEDTAVLYGYVSMINSCHVSVLRDGMLETQYDISRYPYVFPMGSYDADETVSLQIALNNTTLGTMSVLIYALDRDVLERGYRILHNQSMTIENVSDTSICGTVTTAIDGLLYCSIPYDDGWRAQIDGKTVQTTSVGRGAMLAIAVPAGTHKITLQYCPPGFLLGCMISVFSAILFLGYSYCRYQLKKRKRRNGK